MDAELARGLLLHVPAVGVAVAADEGAEPADDALQLLAALGARLLEELGLGALLAVEVPDVLAAAVLLGEPRAPDEEPVLPEPLLEATGGGPPLREALRALLVEILEVALPLLLRAIEIGLEGFPELAQDGDALEVTLGDLVELLLHAGGEVRVDDLGKVLDEAVGDEFAHVVGEEATILEAHVVTRGDRPHDRGVRRRAADTEFLERLHERRLGVPRRRGGEMLLGEHLEHPERVGLGELGEAVLRVLVDLVVPTLRVRADEPVEEDRLPGRAEPVRHPAGGRVDVDADLVEASVRHLRRDGALPDELVEPELVALERRRHAGGVPERRRRADRLVRLLGVARPRLVAARLGEGVLRAELAPHDLVDLAERAVGDVHGVRPHVRDEPDGPLAGEVDPLVEALRDLHRPAGTEAELPGGLLLERRGRERRGRGALPLLLLHTRDAVRGGPQALCVRLGRGGVPEDLPLLVRGCREFAVRHDREAGEERLLVALRGEPDVDAPVLHGHEGPDLALALDDESDGDRLDPARGQAGLHLLPQDRAELVADESVERPAGLLGVEQPAVEGAGSTEGLEDRVAGDLREGHALRGGGVEPEHLGDVERDRLALAVVVRREDDLVAHLANALQLGDVLRLVLRDLVGHREVVVDVDRELALRQIADMAERGTDREVRAEVLLDRLRLRR